MIDHDARAAWRGRLFRLPRWAVPLLLTGMVGLGILVFLLAASLALVLVPLAVAGGAFTAWRLRRQGRTFAVDPFASRRSSAPSSDVIDVEYRIIDKRREP